jgi:large subunit ribosomal protein L10
MEKIGVLYRENMRQQLKKGLDKKGSAFLMCYSGVKSADMSELRRELKQWGAKIYVTRNTLAKRTLKDLGLEKISDFVQGPTAFVYSDGDAAVIAKALQKFSQAHESVKLRGGFLSDSVIDDKQFKELASLPTREVLYAQLLGTLNAPLNNLVFILNTSISKLLYILKEIGKTRRE